MVVQPAGDLMMHHRQGVPMPIRPRGKRLEEAPSAAQPTPLAQFQPEQKAVGQHHSDRMPIKARP
jgi:hypothetical protein